MIVGLEHELEEGWPGKGFLRRPKPTLLGGVIEEERICSGITNLAKQSRAPSNLETQPGCEETQDESIRAGPESVVANGTALPWEMKMKLTTPKGTTVT
ncbi:hypothetical protein TNCV_2835901 [Trichonephila clavipes]|nr:hypothetical protein TNCV_2835901 [Trichonephila clavipes]